MAKCEFSKKINLFVILYKPEQVCLRTAFVDKFNLENNKLGI